MPDREDKETREKARDDMKEGKSPTTAAGEFVHEEIHHVRGGKHGARSPQQAIAIGLSKARRAGVPLPPPKSGAKARTRASARSARRRQGKRRSPRRSRASRGALKRERRSSASRPELSRQARRAARRRPARSRRASARRGARTRRRRSRA